MAERSERVGVCITCCHADEYFPDCKDICKRHGIKEPDHTSNFKKHGILLTGGFKRACYSYISLDVILPDPTQLTYEDKIRLRNHIVTECWRVDFADIEKKWKTPKRVNSIRHFLFEDKFKKVLIYVLSGGTGSGKTTLAYASLFEFLKNKSRPKDRDLKVEFVTWNQLNDYCSRSSDPDSDEAQVLRSFEQCDLLVLDDMKQITTQVRLEKVQELLQTRENLNLKTIITTNLNEKDAKELVGARIYDRIRSNDKRTSVWIYLKDLSHR